MSEPLRVLLVEDMETDAKLIVQALRQLGRPVEHERVEDAVAMRTVLTARPWDVVLTDWSMPRFSAAGALAVMKELELDLPFIIVSGTIGEEAAADVMRAGAHDYVLKDRLGRLAPAVERELRDAEMRDARRRAEEELRTQQARFRALVERSHDGIMLSTREGQTIYMSPAARRIAGVEDGETANALDRVHPDDRARIDEFRGKLVSEPGAMVEVELRTLRPDGTVRWLEAIGTNLLDDPDVRAIVGNFRDVTDRKNADEALRVSEARFARLADSGIIGIVVADLNGPIVEVNDACLRMTGYTRAEAHAGVFDWKAMTPPEWHEVDVVAGEELARRGYASPWEKELICKDGSRVPVLIGAAMLDGTVCISFLADLTEQKRTQEKLRSTEEQLRHTQKMDAVSRLAGGMAHDFNNILSVILSYTGLVLDEMRAGDPLREDLEEMRKAGNRAANLTRQLLLFSRQQVIEPKVLDLNDLLVQMDKLLHRLVGEDVELTFSLQPEIGRVKLDPGHVEQVVMNLVVNARDAMPTGGKLTIETANVLLDQRFASAHIGVKAGPHVLLAVTDAGTGMDRASVARILEPFYTTKAIGKGTGLGLSTVFGIVQQSGGTIWVYSEPGRGSTFKVYLPRVEAELDAVEARGASTARGGTEVVLLVEDEQQVRAVARGILVRGGYQVIEARDVAHALLLGESHAGEIHMLLTDVVMPQMSGPELANRLTSKRPGMKVLFMSGYTDDNVVRHGVLSSDASFLQKPFTTEILMAKVREILDR